MRAMAWNRQDIETWMDNYISVQQPCVVIKGRIAGGHGNVSSLLKEQLSFDPDAPNRMTVDVESMKRSLFPGHSNAAVHSFSLEDAGNKNQAWICTSVLVRRKGGYKIVTEHLSRA